MSGEDGREASSEAAEANASGTDESDGSADEVTTEAVDADAPDGTEAAGSTDPDREGSDGGTAENPDPDSEDVGDDDVTESDLRSSEDNDSDSATGSDPEGSDDAEASDGTNGPSTDFPEAESEAEAEAEAETESEAEAEAEAEAETESEAEAEAETESEAEAETESEAEAEAEAETESDSSSTVETYAFEHVPREHLPPDLQYTPEFDDDWVYPSGAKAGGTRDHAPVQGLEIGVVGSIDELQATVVSVLDALTDHYDATGSYPRHRIIRDEDSFRAQAPESGVGLVAVIQPRPDAYDGVIGHMEALRGEEASAPETITPNSDTARALVEHLRARLDPTGTDEGTGTGTNRADNAAVDATDSDDDGTDTPADGEEPDSAADGTPAAEPLATDLWDEGHRIGTTPLLERYAPLASDVMFDPTEGPVDFDGPGVESVAQLGFDPEYVAADDARPDD